jgi:micrococcal nuclease
MYEYKVKEVVRVVDGDTVDVFLDLGFNITVKKRIRLYGINTPETRLQSKIKNVEERKAEKSRGLKAKEQLKMLLYSARELYIRSEGLGKYGRVLGIIKDQDGLCINDYMLEHGYATKM